MNQIDYNLLSSIAGITSAPAGGAYNLRYNGEGVERHSTENVTILSKTDKPGIDIIVKPGTKGETIYIPVMVTHSGIKDKVYNDFEIGEDADVTIIAGCGIHNDGCGDSEHDGIHSFHIGKNARMKYVEKHYGEGEGTGARILNPTTIVKMEEGSYCEMETVQIKGVDSTIRETTAHLEAGAKMLVVEKLMTHDHQVAHSNMDVHLDGEGSSVQIISRSVAKDESVQVFHPKAIGNAPCRAHVQCDTIIMDTAKVSSIPEITSNHADAQIVHEAAIGRINNDQLMKLQTFGMTQEEAEEVIVQGFLK
ncbi:MAG: SufB/SufD family protein [Massiliimalia sp.]|jgi:Fe-S cluster assembly scaffold protein SufB